jgi:hypothetical protein
MPPGSAPLPSPARCTPVGHAHAKRRGPLGAGRKIGLLAGACRISPADAGSCGTPPLVARPAPRRVRPMPPPPLRGPGAGCSRRPAPAPPPRHAPSGPQDAPQTVQTPPCGARLQTPVAPTQTRESPTRTTDADADQVKGYNQTPDAPEDSPESPVRLTVAPIRTLPEQRTRPHGLCNPPT